MQRVVSRFWLAGPLGVLIGTLGGCFISFEEYPTGEICDADVAEAQALDDPALRKCANDRANQPTPVDAGADQEDAEAGLDGS